MDEIDAYNLVAAAITTYRAAVEVLSGNADLMESLLHRRFGITRVLAENGQERWCRKGREGFFKSPVECLLTTEASTP